MMKDDDDEELMLWNCNESRARGGKGPGIHTDCTIPGQRGNRAAVGCFIVVPNNHTPKRTAKQFFFSHARPCQYSVFVKYLL